MIDGIPFYQSRAVCFRPGKPFKRINPIRINGCPKQQVAMRRGGFCRKFIRHVHFCSVGIELAVRANNPIEREKDGFIGRTGCESAIAKCDPERCDRRRVAVRVRSHQSCAGKCETASYAAIVEKQSTRCRPHQSRQHDNAYR